MSTTIDLSLLAYARGPAAFAYARNFTENPTVAELMMEGKVPDYTLQALGAFFATIFLEWLAGAVLGKKIYRVNDTLTSIMLGAVSLLAGIIVKTLQVGSYAWVYSHYRLASFGVDSLFTWIVMFLGCDCGYYWMHRMSHTYHVMWNGHSVHHSGEDYNLATALRQGALQGVFSWVFYLPLALCGFHPAVYLGHGALNTLGQFWIHTKLIGGLGPLEYLLNTPSHHRCHHRIPGNCNYAGVLIIWDRLFGTFEAEVAQVEAYGLARQYETFDPVVANFTHGTRVVAEGGISKLFLKRANHTWVCDPMALFRPIKNAAFGRWAPTDGHNDAKRVKMDSPLHPLMAIHCTIQFLITLFASVLFLLRVRHLERDVALMIAVALLWSYSSIGRLFDAPNMWNLVQETFRLIPVVLGCVSHRNHIVGGKFARPILIAGGVLLMVWGFAVLKTKRVSVPRSKTT